MHNSITPCTIGDAIECVFTPADADNQADKYHVTVTQIFPEDPDLDLPALPPKPQQFCDAYRPGKNSLSAAYNPVVPRIGENLDMEF